MKVVCDVHISKKVVKFFLSNSVEAVHVNDILESWYTKDVDIAYFADENNYVVLTKDADFKVNHLLLNSPKKLLKVNLGNIPTKMLVEILSKNLEFLRAKFTSQKVLIEINSDSILIID